MSIKVHMKERERRNRLKIWKLIGIKIQVLPTDTIAQWVEHRRDKPRTWVQILASVVFFICSVSFFLSLLHRRSVGRSNFDWGLQKLNNVDSNSNIQLWKNAIYIYIYCFCWLLQGHRFSGQKGYPGRPHAQHVTDPAVADVMLFIAAVSIRFGLTETFNTTSGVLQGETTLSPRLFIPL